MLVVALLDEGSTVTLVDADVASQIGASGPTRPLLIHGAKGMCTSDKHSQRVKLTIRDAENNRNYHIVAHTISNLNLPEQQHQGRFLVPKLLIGQDNAHLIVSREVHKDIANTNTQH